MATLNLNLRGLQISPEKKKATIHYYFCLIDLPSSVVSQGVFSINPPNPGDTTLSYSFSGVLSEAQPGDQIQTIALPLFTNQQIAQPNSTNDNLTVQVTDSAQNSVTGNPNSKRPPVVQLIDTSQQLIPKNIFIKSATPNTTNYFIITLVNTDSSKNESPLYGQVGGFTNSFTMAVVGNDPNAIVGLMVEKDGQPPVCALGFWPTSDTTTYTRQRVYGPAPGGFNADNGKYWPIDYSSPISL